MAGSEAGGGEAGWVRLLETATRVLAVAGGVLALALSVMVTMSVLGRWASGYAWGQRLGLAAIPGDFELVEMATAVAIFCFLPFCQWRRGNIIVDAFTTALPRRAVRAIDALWDLVYALAAAVIGYCMVAGTLDARASHQVTMVLGYPVWPAFALSTLLVFALAGVAVATALRLVRGTA